MKHVSMALGGLVAAIALTPLQAYSQSRHDSVSNDGAIVSAPKPQSPTLSPEPPEPSLCLSEATIRVTATPAHVTWGESSVIRWSVGLPGRCPNVQVRLNGQSVPRTGNRSVQPARSSLFTIIVSETHLGVYGQTSGSTLVGVSYPARVVIDTGTPSPVASLLGALVDSTNEHQTVELCGVDLDFTGIKDIVVGSNRSLIASPGCARGPRSFGPRILVTDPRGSSPLFIIQGDNVRFSGFRLEGPTRLIGQGGRKEKAIVISPFAAADPIRNIEISNMEIFHWSGLGVQVYDNVELAERGRLFNTNEGAVRIRGNFFHHNRHGAGWGYGVVVSAGAYALVERNVFDENRHAIAGGSRNKDALDYSGYTARDNLILAGGGKHCPENILLPCWQTHQIDMHGDQNEWYSDSNWQCGTAGETIIIQRNTILYTSGDAIKIRGNPADKAVVDGNVFRHGSRGDAITQNGFCGSGDNIVNPIDVRPNNVFGADPMAQLGSCDFVGDGQLDQFMATGVTWWAKSPVTQQWRYLNTMTERLPQLQLGRVDGDAVCDVAPRGLSPLVLPPFYSRNGTTPWRPTMVLTQ